MNGAFAEELKLLKEYWGNSPGDVYFSPKDGYAHRKEHEKLGESVTKASKGIEMLKTL